MVETTAKEKVKAAVIAEKKVATFEKARVAMEKRSSELEVKLRGDRAKTSGGASMNIAWAENVANLKATLEACENK